MNKVCKECGIEKPLDEFYKHKGMKDGHLNKCISCHLQYSRNRKGTDAYRASRDKYNHKNMRHICDRALIWARNNPEKRHAETLLDHAVSRGKIIKSTNCQKCGRDDRIIQGHHPDYSKPLDVVWLCPPCHHWADEERKSNI